MKKFLKDPEEQEYQLINVVYALFCCNVLIGGLGLLGIAS